ncbi:(d)CMP kinase [Parabacteroides sp. Marseille-P3160]|uniref:(d)CMP kinase n=1 Tax=Parabacteroides sp. Marseille-P3160 TaxID=1917887 RepID=UPI0009BC6D8F|nr:(d)CMP kinase [Parabacteroides sp. Marseille-P3160]
MKLIIAIDGYSSCGKSTMAKELARRIGYTYIDTGAMYRAVTWYALQKGWIANGIVDAVRLQQSLDEIEITFRVNPQNGRTETWVNGRNVEQEIRSLEVAKWVSQVAALSFVRRALVDRQQAMGKDKGIVMDGRDIGTVVFPDAELKIFVTASAEVRAQRRVDEMREKGEEASYEAILENVRTRDRIDTTRADSPLKAAGDARILDNTHLSLEEQNAWLFEQYQQVLTNCKEV